MGVANQEYRPAVTNRRATHAMRDLVVGGETWNQVFAHRERLIRLAARLGAGDVAEDITHEAMIRAVIFDRLDHERLGPFLSAVTARLVVDHHRRLTRDMSYGRRITLPDSVQPDFQSEVCDRAEANWAVSVLRDRCPPAIVEILSERADGLTWDEIASRRNETVRAVETRVRRALLALRAYLTLRS